MNNGNSVATEENVSELKFTLSHLEAGVEDSNKATPQITVNQNNSYFISGYKTVSFTNGDDVVLDDDNISKNIKNDMFKRICSIKIYNKGEIKYV